MNKEIIENINKLVAVLTALANAIVESLKGENCIEQTSPKVEIRIEEIRAILAEKSKAGKQAEIRGLINKFGAKKLTDVDPARYDQLLKEAEGL